MASRPIIAILDDEVNMRIAWRRLLQWHGYHVRLFQSGEELLEAMKHQAFDCILLDLHMPAMNGFTVLRHLKDQFGPQPVVVITGHDQAGNAERVAKLGATAYLIKPVDEIPLLEAVRASGSRMAS